MGTGTFQFEIVAAIAMGLGFIIWLVRLEARVNAAQDENIKLKIELAKLETKSQKDIDTLSLNHKSENRVVWEKIDSLQSMIQDVLKSLGRLEGKLETNRL